MMHKYPKTRQFRDIIRQVTDKTRFSGLDEVGNPIFNNSELPTLNFYGTVKLHGTNAGIEYDTTSKEIRFYSRERVITPESDNAGFATYMSQYKEQLLELLEFEAETEQLWSNRLSSKVVVYGEWCGGNIQKGVGISGLPKMFVAFRITHFFEDETSEIDIGLGFGEGARLTIPNIYSADEFQTYNLAIDFNKPTLAQPTLIELTQQVEDKCPVAAYFGQEGIGEGIVWTCLEDPELFFKVKGEKHSSSKVKTLVDIELVKAIDEFVEMAVTENRLQQGLDKLRELGLPADRTSTGNYLSWIIKDIQEEEAETLEASGLDRKKLSSAISHVAKKWYFEKC
jgi:hypothetical protein